VGSHPEELLGKYPNLDFSHLPHCWWYDGEKDHRGFSVEPPQVLQQRADSFIAYLQTPQTRSTAIVSHGNFIRATTGIQPDNCEIIRFDPENRSAASING
jgi:broad specificity phosphatase PhoE